MTDAVYEKHRARILALTEKWIPLLGLRWWKIEIEYARDGLVGDTPHTGNWVCTAKCNAKWEYLDAKISFNMQTVEDLSDEELERVFVHECCHVLVNEMRAGSDEAIKHEERVVSTLTNAFLWTFKASKTLRAASIKMVHHPGGKRKK